MSKILSLLTICLSICTLQIQAQSYEDSLLRYREAYKNSLLTGNHALKETDIEYLRFYKPDRDYCVKATFVPVTSKGPFLMATKHGGTCPAMREYGIVYFKMKGAAITLHVFRFLPKSPDDDIRLFIPFTDGTNFRETFRGGRYINISADNLDNNTVTIDFNKCYNPHTAYEKGYPYIIPPKMNNLYIDIQAGEKIFGHNPGY